MFSICDPVLLTSLSGPAPGASLTGSHVPFSTFWLAAGLLRHVRPLSGQDDELYPSFRRRRFLRFTSRCGCIEVLSSSVRPCCDL
jgi:hypothetical protein